MTARTEIRLVPCLTQRGHLVLASDGDAPEQDPALADRLQRAFAKGAGYGLLRLGAAEVGRTVPLVFAYWREFASRYVTALCTRPDSDERRGNVPPPSDQDLAALAAAAPVMPGAEYLTPDVLRALWDEIGTALETELDRSGSTVQAFLKKLNPAWNVVGRVHFNLAENRKDEDAPFAFLATYTSRLTTQGKVQHSPLGEALREYAGAARKEQLLSLLLPVQRAAEQCVWLKHMVDTRTIYHPLRWSPEEAFRLLNDVPQLERAGVVVRMPATWNTGRPPRPQVTATVGAHPPRGLGGDALLDFRMDVALDGERLTAAEVNQILAGASGLLLLRGKWVEVDKERLARMIDRLQRAEQLAADGGFTFADAMRMVAGADVREDGPATGADPDWSRVVAGPWLAETLQRLRAPDGLTRSAPGVELRGTLRPYQHAGVRWLHLLSQLGLGACLADDMGLGKTIQVLALLLLRRGQPNNLPSLLVAPASLLANWIAEIDRFAPSLKALVAHPSVMPAAELAALVPEKLAAVDLVITSYGSLRRIPWLAQRSWNLLILDEAQAIKNPDAKQTRAAKQLTTRGRIALTGTPIENRLSDLWSIFDFINPGLLGTAKEFAGFARRLADQPHAGSPYAPLRDLVRPYILRRLKTDRSVISDLPDKTEIRAFCPLSRKQAALYQQAVKELAASIEGVAGIRRKGLVLAFLTRFKQICNHPSQWLGDGIWAEQDSGKWARLRELCEVIAAKQEKALVFTQFREVTAPLASFLAGVFGRSGLVLHGETAVRQRQSLVRRFQEDEVVPFFVLSLKAGGSGLNLTAASHVIHFDRWWNPGVENQATDRAFRIGQTKSVLVHKFVCRGTVEEKIDGLIESKRHLSKDVLEGGAEVNLTELKDEELLRLVALDLKAAMTE